MGGNYNRMKKRGNRGKLQCIEKHAKYYSQY